MTTLVVSVRTDEDLVLLLPDGRQLRVQVEPKSKLETKVRVTAPRDVEISRVSTGHPAERRQTPAQSFGARAAADVADQIEPTAIPLPAHQRPGTPDPAYPPPASETLNPDNRP